MNHKFIISLCLTSLVFPFTSIHASESTGTLIIENADDTDTFDLYQMLIYHEDTDSYTFTDSFASIIPETMNITEYRLLSDDSETFKKLLTQYAIYIKDNEIASCGTITGNGSFTSLAQGQYLILGSSVTGNIFLPMAASFPNEEDNTETITVKKSKPVIDLTVKDHQYFIHDTVDYTILSTIPSYPSDTMHDTYEITCTIPAGLQELNNIVIEASRENPFVKAETLKEGTEYTLSQNENTLTFTFEYSEISSFTMIQITCTSSLKEDAVVTEGMPLTASLYYSINPYIKEDQKEKAEDTESVYTFALDLTKIDADSKEPLQDVEFALYRDASCTDKIKFDQNETKYIVSSDHDETLKTDVSGKLLLVGLKDGTYYLKETKTNESYHLPTDPFIIEIVDQNDNGLAESNEKDTDSGIVTKIITNTLDTMVLPMTGGTGTIVFSCIGLAGMSVITCILTYLRKHS